MVALADRQTWGIFVSVYFISLFGALVLLANVPPLLQTYLFCRCLPPTKESTSTKLIYATVLLMAAVLMSALLFPTLQQKLQVVFRDFNATW